MACNRNLALHATLPERYARFDLLASTIDHRGRLLALLVDPAQEAASGLPWKRPGPWSPPIPRFDATAVLCDGADIHEIPLHGLDQWFSQIDIFGEGVILGAARIPRPEYGQAYEQSTPANDITLPRNVRAFDSVGNPVGAFYAGDGIEQLLTDPGGRIWISYFDEATYQFHSPDGTWSCIDMPGLARWDNPCSDPWFAFNDTGSEVFWCDCYALNVGRLLVHACPYVGFPLVEIDARAVRSITPNPVTRCHGLAVSGSTFAFLDHHRHGEAIVWQIRQARRQDGEITETGRQTLLLPGGREPTGWARGRVGRDANLWMYEEGNPRHWYRYQLECG
ncbi:hypothetical protein [Nocardia sp. NBC_01327]|uniref:hypothetical protein n=1 Tax=Nocardia sp. NBC_01327 TaxID=2903593 RepID=UPI002E0D3781|nr:hypothetical protein OG326_33090 [Nocardia sp. NBC_01327]